MTQERSPRGCDPRPLPAPDSHWREWVTYGLCWAAARPPIADSARDAVVDGGRFMTLHAYREAEPGPRWRALYDATWPAYRSWYTREGLAAFEVGVRGDPT